MSRGNKFFEMIPESVLNFLSSLSNEELDFLEVYLIVEQRNRIKYGVNLINARMDQAEAECGS